MIKPVLGSQLRFGHPLSKGFVGYWLMNEGSGSIINDLSGNGNTGMITACTWLSGKVGPTLDFDGATSLIDFGTCGDRIFTENGPITISAWIKPNTTGENALGRILDRSGTLYGPSFSISANNRLLFRADGSTDLYQNSVDNSIILGIWQHVLMTWDGSLIATNVHFYVNAKEVSYITTTDGVSLVDNVAASLRIGNTYIPVYTFDGSIDNVMIYNRVLSVSEIALLYREPFAMFDYDPIELWVGSVGAGIIGNAGIMTPNTGYWGPTF